MPAGTEAAAARLHHHSAERSLAKLPQEDVANEPLLIGIGQPHQLTQTCALAVREPGPDAPAKESSMRSRSPTVSVGSAEAAYAA